MAFASALLPILGTAASVGGSIIGGLYQGQVANNNAAILQENAQYAQEAGQEQQAVTSLKGASQVANTKASIAANGTDVNSGSAVDVVASQRAGNELDAETVLNNANLEAYGYTVQAQNEKAQAQQDIVGGFLKGAGSLVGNAQSLPFKWSNALDNGSTPTADTGGSEWAGTGFSYG